MISQKYINGLGFDTLEEVFQYVVDSRINGQFSQVKDIVRMMSAAQHGQFVMWLQENKIDIHKAFLKETLEERRGNSRFYKCMPELTRELRFQERSGD